MIKIGDTFKAGDEVWRVARSFMPDVYTFIHQETERELRIIYENDDELCKNRWSVFDNDSDYGLSQDEMRMCIEIIDKLKEVQHDTK
jgi:hypothetical protein